MRFFDWLRPFNPNREKRREKKGRKEKKRNV